MRRPVSVIAALCCAACASSGAPAPASPPASLPPSQVEARLAAAQDDVFANRYSAADAAYAQLLSEAPRDPSVRAALAIFLAYRDDTGDALTQARQGLTLDAHSGEAAAALCRAQDWSGDVRGAVTTGRSAVSLAPSDALAHLFLAEALADSGDLAGSSTQLTVADGLIASHPTPYLRAEDARERANLDGDSGNRSAQVAALQQARSLQSGWLYRTAELVDAEVGAGDSTSAQQTLDSLTAQAPGDPETLTTLGADAVFIGDATAALALWSRALELDPANASLLDESGELDVAAKDDINAAIAEFERALQADPHDSSAAAYLLALARYVQHQPDVAAQEIATAITAGVPAHAIHPPAPPQPDAATATAARQALAAVNATRAAAGLPPVQLESHLGASAASHSYYWLFNNLSPTVMGIGVHWETAGMTGYTGQYPWTRAIAFGYPNERIGEDITHRGDPVGAVRDWVDSVFHRFPILRPDLSYIGYGQARIGTLAIEDMEFGFAPATSHAPVRYPVPGQTRVPVQFVDNEVPDPVPAGAPRTTGYPVTVTFSAADSVALSAFTLTGADGASLPAYMLAPSSQTENSASLLPITPLRPGSVYTAHIAATVNGSGYDSTWSFTTTS